MTLQQTIGLKLEEETKVWIMFSFTVERMSLGVIEKEIFNNSFLSNLEFFQCKTWVNLSLIKTCLMVKSKVADQVALTAKDQKWSISSIKETTILMVLILLETKLNSISKCNTCSNNKVNTNNLASTISQNTNWFKAAIEQSHNLQLQLILTF